MAEKQIFTLKNINNLTTFDLLKNNMSGKLELNYIRAIYQSVFNTKECSSCNTALK